MRYLTGMLCVATVLSTAEAGSDQVREAATRAIALLQSSQKDWYAKQSCESCHHQILPAIAFRVAREHGLTVCGDEESPVASLIVGDDKMAMMLSHNLLERGIEVQPIVRPAVSATTARLRFFLTANHTEEQILETVPVVAQQLEKLRRGVE